MTKIIMVANRLPVTARLDEGGVTLAPSQGGLATGLSNLATGMPVEWVGWPGIRTDRVARFDDLSQRLASIGLTAVDLTAEEVDGYYNQFSNGAIWPLYHYQIDRMPLRIEGFDAYHRVNERFAEAVVARWRPGDLIWVHDYHLQLLPAMLRAALPQAPIGFFLHVPFPSSEVFRVLPRRDEILAGILGSDLVGFHTHAYARHFAASALRILGAESSGEILKYEGRTVRIAAFPLGVEVTDPETETGAVGELAEGLRGIRQHDPGRKVILSVDRLDYTKGLPRRLLAVEQLLHSRADLRGKVVFVQIAVPSRDEVPAYEAYRRRVEGLVGRINGRFGMPGYQPVHYVSRGFAPGDIQAAYAFADVMMVTPLRDGMNLVAKEFVAARTDLDGVLVLSEFAGASAELGEAVLVNPYDIDGVVEGLERALAMPAGERIVRMKALRDRIKSFRTVNWAQRFVGLLQSSATRNVDRTYSKPEDLARKARAGARFSLFLDYDGTLFPIVRLPQLAVPDDALMQLMAALASRPDMDVHLISGRTADVLQKWFGHLPLHLHAEHGARSREAGSVIWSDAEQPVMADETRTHVLGVLEELCRNTPGSFVEEKVYSIAWHYRMADPALGEKVANELRLHAREHFGSLGLDVLSGKRVIELRVRGAGKDLPVRRALKESEDSLAILVGDDQTDEDMFVAARHGDMTVVVGDQDSAASYRVTDPAAVRRFLTMLANPEGAT